MTIVRRLCVIIPGFSDGGAQRQCIYLLNELQNRPEWDVHVIRFSSGVHDGLLQKSNLTIHELPLKSNYDFRVLTKLSKLVREIDPHILMSWLHSADVYSFFIRRLMPRTRWVMTERDSTYPKEFRYQLRRALGRYADAIVANSAAGSDYWKGNGAKGERFVVGNILNRAAAVSTNRAPSTRAIYVGRLEPQKNVVALARAAIVLARRRAGAEFLFIGEGSLRGEIEALVKEGGVESQVRLEGFQRNVAQYLGSASLLASFSHHEGLPNALMEATAAGVPIVASAIPEHAALLGSDYPYYVAETESPEAAASVLERALDDPNASVHLAYAQSLVNGMTPTAVTNRYLAIFDQVLGARA